MFIYVFGHVCVLVLRHYSSALFTGAPRGRVRDVVCVGTMFCCDLFHALHVVIYTNICVCMMVKTRKRLSVLDES